MSVRHCLLGLLLAAASATPSFAQTADVEFFEAKIRPVLASKCYRCHNSTMVALKGDLILDTKEGLFESGIVVPSSDMAGMASR